MIAIQLNPPWHVVTPLGEGFAHALIDYGPNHNSVIVFAPFEANDQFMSHIDICECKMGGNAMYDIQHPKPFKERQL
tara:strand:- start:39316 stop:39546 length:231 start_codon:yes stop_codon:yes gene_type:complete